MKLRYGLFGLTILSAFILSGCISNEAGSSSDAKQVSLPIYSLAPYQEQSNNLETNSLVGTWIGLHTFSSTIGSTIDPKSTASESGSALEVMIISKDENDTLYASSCLGGFKELTESDTALISSERTFNKINSKTLTTVERRTSAMSAFANNPFSSTRFIKISNGIEPLGSINWKWSTESSNDDSPIACFYMENINGKSADQSAWVSQGVKVGSQNSGMELSTRLIPNLGFCSKKDISTPSICQTFGGVFDSSDDVNLSINEETETTFSLNFNGSDSDTGISVNGSVQITFPNL